MSFSIHIQTVLYHNEKSSIARSLESIANAVKNSREKSDIISDIEVWYGDASKTPLFSDEEINAFNRQHAGLLKVFYKFFGENTGTSRGHNILGREVKKEYMLTMNPDIVFAPDFFDEITKPFLNSKLKAGISEARQTPIEHPKDYNRKTGEVAWSSGACILYKKETFDKIGGFDEKNFFMYCDDVDLSWRVRLLGLKAYYCPRAIVFHSKTLSRSGNWEPTSAEKYYSAEAALLIAHKYGNARRVKKLLGMYLKGRDADMRRAAEEYLKREAEGGLDKPLRGGRKVATFEGDLYTKHRFKI